MSQQAARPPLLATATQMSAVMHLPYRGAYTQIAATCEYCCSYYSHELLLFVCQAVIIITLQPARSVLVIPSIFGCMLHYSSNSGTVLP